MSSKLIQDGVLQPSKYPVYMEYREYSYGGLDVLFAGQADQNGKPDGIVRIITHH